MADRVHFVGIGGVGMAGLARLLHQRGDRITGSEVLPNRLTAELASLGIRISEGHRVANAVPPPDWAVRTPAVPGENPEVTALRQRGVPVFSRGDVLAAYSRERATLAVAGAHGKTTTSAMLAWILRRCGVDCGYAVGGETGLPGRVADAGTDPVFVCEADESDGTLVRYAPRVGVLTHVEWDHPERFATPEAIHRCYRRFVERSEVLWIHAGDREAERLSANHLRLRRVGREDGVDLCLRERRDDPGGQRIHVMRDGICLEGRLPLPGEHNAWNALMAVGAAGEAGVEAGRALAALEDFPGVGRRFDLREAGGVRVVQDYAHHPTELRALIGALNALDPARIRMVFQPHRYSRTRRLLGEFARCFAGCGQLDLLPVYPAFELPEEGADSECLARVCREHFTGGVRVWDSLPALADRLAAEAEPGDVIAVAGAGPVGALQAELLERLEGAPVSRRRPAPG